LETEFIEEIEEIFGVGADPNYVDIHTKVFCGPTAKGKGKQCPRDGLLDCSYVDALEPAHVGKANVMLSWCRLTSVRTVVAALLRWCQRIGKDAEDVYVWQCVLCHNHFRDSSAHAVGPTTPPAELTSPNRSDSSGSDGSPPPEVMPTTMPEPVMTPRSRELRRGTVESVSDSISAFQWRFRNIGTLLVLCSPLKSPSYLRRIWCLCEFFTACVSQCGDVHIVSTEEEEVEFTNALKTEGLSSYYEAFNKVDIQNADARFPHEKEGILELLREEMAKRTVTDAGAFSADNPNGAQVAAQLSSSPGQRLKPELSSSSSSPGPHKAQAQRRRKAPSLSQSKQTAVDTDEFVAEHFSASPPRDSEDIERRSRCDSESKADVMQENEAELRKKDGASDLAAVDSEVARVLHRWLCEKAQQELQYMVAVEGPAPLEAFLNVAGLLRMDSDFDPYVFVVLQQGLRYSQATCSMDSPGYGVLLREMGSCLCRHGRCQEALSHFHAARRFYESADLTNTAEYVELLQSISQNAVVGGMFEERKKQPVSNMVTFKQVPAPTPASSAFMQARFSDSPGIMCEDPLQDLQAAFVCLPTCICNTSTNDFSQIIDLSREETRDITPGVSIPSLAFPKEISESGMQSDIVDFDTLMKERSQITETRHRSKRMHPVRQEPMEPADSGFLDMLLLWTSKMGWNQQFGCSSNGGVPSLLHGCANRTTQSEDDEWI
jgi:hypothetical protein